MANHVGICRLCGDREKLQKSHIIPAGIFRHMITGGNGLTLIKKDMPPEPGKRGNGEYEHLLCQRCERGLAPYDEYGIKFIRNELGVGFCYMATENTPKLEYFMGVDIMKLHYFFLSLLWRISVSTRPFFSSVNLPNSEGMLKRCVEDMVLSRPLVRQEWFVFSLLRFSNYKDPFALIKNPELFSVDDHIFCDIYIGPYKLFIQTDDYIIPTTEQARIRTDVMFTTQATIAEIITIEEDPEYERIMAHIDASEKAMRGV
jgi:hypothetical protein